MSDCSGNAGIVVGGEGVGRNDCTNTGSGSGRPSEAGRKMERKQRKVKSGGGFEDIGKIDNCGFGAMCEGREVRLRG